MKNKIFSLLAVVVFATSLISVATSETNCTDVAIQVQDTVEGWGFGKQFANDCANVAYDDCIEEGGSPN